MKKKILGFALIAMTITAFNGMAQKADNNTTTAKQECVKAKNADRQECCRQLCPFDGMNLTDTQKAQIQQLNSKQKAARRQQAQSRKEKKQEMNNDRFAERQAAKKAYLDELKAIIGPDNYVVFLENFYVNGGGNHDGKSAFRHANGNKDQANRQRNCDRKENRCQHTSHRNMKTNCNNTVSNNS